MLLAVALVVVAFLAFFIYRTATHPAVPKPSHFREPVPAGCFRVVGHDEFDGGAELTNVVGDFATLDEAVKEAAAARARAEFVEGAKGRPTKFFIYDDKENFVCDWKGPRS